MSLAFSPAVVASSSYTSQVNTVTESYILQTGKNINTVAKLGDEIDVSGKLPSLSISDESYSHADIHINNKLAGYAQTGAVALSNGNAVKSGERMLNSAANNELNNSTQQLLSQFGTARVQMNVNEDFKLDGSMVDVLVPLYDNQKSLLFTQLGARNKDDRNTVNVGAGVRTFQNSWMYGANAFFDNDVTGKNRRVGVGAEAWTDYLKFSGNSYFGTTDWHHSRDFADYKERPANGYDVRAETYLPSHPQLGGKVMYEKYRGDDVALFGKDNRQKNPYAITAGVNYTPIPLVTIGAEHRAGKGSKNDSNINFQLNYRLGESWQSHISPSAVAATRTLAGSRYDLVERNNNIVLNYQEQKVIQLILPAMISGEGGTSVPLSAEVSTRHGLERIEWDSSALIAAGGSLTPVSAHAVVVGLPSHRLTRSGSNAHTLSAVAHDIQGNVSLRATVQITVMPSTVAAVNLTATADNEVANGIATNAVKAIVMDAGNNLVPGQVVTFTASNGANVTTVIGTTGVDGVATATLTNMKSGISAVTATVNGSSQTVDTTFVANSSTAEITAANLTATANNEVANGIATNAVKAIVTDAGNNLVPGQVVTFTASNGAKVTTVIGTTGVDGIATATLTNTDSGISVVTATVNGSSQTVDTTFVADGSTAKITAAKVTADRRVANGTATNAVVVIVTDAGNNPVAGQVVAFTASNGAKVTAVIGTTGVDGVATATLTNMKSGISAVTATVNGSSQTVDTTFVADGSTAEITAANLTATTDNEVANGRATNAVKAIVTDAGNNLVPGQVVTFTASNGANVTTVIGTTGVDGVATATLTNTAPGVSVVTATVNGSNQTVSTTFVEDSMFTGIAVNGHVFTVNDEFPKTGFTAATFILNMNRNASDFTWSSNQPGAVNVNGGGQVKLNSKPTGPVTITATPKDGGSPLSYTFAVQKWFIHNGSTMAVWSDAVEFCSLQLASQPSRTDLSSTNYSFGTRLVGSLFDEWGRMDNYTGSGFIGTLYWTGDTPDPSTGYHYLGDSIAGVTNSYSDADIPRHVMCRR
ncbi:inverse autotransporter beta domain-containing protein [Yersinia sp. 2553 StPb PI]|uniref:inverse autotransporter beta domain-containing protein n=1 Tax=Yersinia sp. 2553 StPb PI TaxID=3117411 RepID=UPI003FA49FB9